MKSLAFHPLAEVLPLIEGDEFAELVRSIMEHGLRDPITVLDHMILDGRNRYRACLEAGVEPRIEPFNGDDPIAFVTDKNLRRRQLTSGEKAMAVVKYANFPRGCTKRNHHTGMPASKTLAEIAAMAGINKETVSDAKTICANGTSEEIASVINGAAAISTVAKEVRARRNGIEMSNKVIRGCRIKVPAGVTVSDKVRDGLKLEERGVKLIKVAKELGMSAHTYTVIRDTLLLSRHDDLGKVDKEAVARALQDIDETRQVGNAKKIIEPIAKLVWGTMGHRLKKPDKRRFKQFDNAINFLLHTCENAVEMVIPFITHAQAEEAGRQLSAAENSLRKLRERIREVQYD